MSASDEMREESFECGESIVNKLLRVIEIISSDAEQEERNQELFYAFIVVLGTQAALNENKNECESIKQWASDVVAGMKRKYKSDALKSAKGWGA